MGGVCSLMSKCFRTLFRGNDSSDLKVFFQSLDSARKLRRRCFRRYRVAVLAFLENGKVSNDFR